MKNKADKYLLAPPYSVVRGFSLIELLVVIAILGILMSLGAASYRTAQAKARDSERRQVIKHIQDGFEQYFSANGEYDSSADCSVILGDSSIFTTGVPLDPKDPTMSYTFACTASTYCVCAEFESDNGDYTTSGCSQTGTDFDFYCVENQQ